MFDERAAWKIEEVCLNAWPAIRTAYCDEFLLRFADGYRRRSNSINPTRPTIGNVEEKIRKCSALFEREEMHVIFRVPTISDPALDRHLAARGFGAEGETITLAGAISEMPFAPSQDTELQSDPDQHWLDVAHRLSERTTQQSAVYRRLLDHLAIPAVFASHRYEGEIVAVGFAAVHDGHVCFESIATNAAMRGRGFAQAMMGSLIDWGQKQGAKTACLQVEADNPPAVALYGKLGFSHEVYRYHYRRSP